MIDLPFYRKFLSKTFLHLLVLGLVLASIGCGSLQVKTKDPVPVFLTVESAEKERLIAEINRYSEVKAIRGKVGVKFEDNSFAESGIAEKYKTANGLVVVQDPSKINLKIQIPVVGTDLVQMTSDGDKFRVAVICCVEEKYKVFASGTNAKDYSRLREKARQVLAKGSQQEQSISVFSSLRPQHFTDALLMRPVNNGEDYIYTQSEIYQEEAGTTKEKSRIARVIRGYYLLDELKKNGSGNFQITRRFWFDRVGGIRLARQQIFDDKGVLENDITYGTEQKFGENGGYSMPVQVQITRPKERYSVKLTYEEPAAVVIGKIYDPEVFVLENRWQLPEVDLDKQAEQSALLNQLNQ
jgi:hypothetical protein